MLLLLVMHMIGIGEMMSKTGALMNDPDSEEALADFAKSLENVLECIRGVQKVISTVTVSTSEAQAPPLRTSGLPQSTSTPKPKPPPSPPNSDEYTSDEAPPKLPASAPPIFNGSSSEDDNVLNGPISTGTSTWMDESLPAVNVPPLQPHLIEDIDRHRKLSPSNEWMKRYTPDSHDQDSTLSSFAPTNPPSLLQPSTDARVPSQLDDGQQQAIQYPSSLGALSITNPSMIGTQNEPNSMKDREGTGTVIF